ncbi:hypothetical protein B0H63DRAFT_117796 [Podospora didyma]|uniref:Uncharacterized protein n=1 Tax=Podospora didyma TaxID=330526 RepID=A0AAE0NZK8_9PEZI|nr:hypothetical protein B0H63DRAFT_117796 [Podospora didyma]
MAFVQPSSGVLKSILLLSIRLSQISLDLVQGTTWCRYVPVFFPRDVRLFVFLPCFISLPSPIWFTFSPPFKSRVNGPLVPS